MERKLFSVTLITLLMLCCSTVFAGPVTWQADKLKRPTGYRHWVFIGSPVTPHDMNDGKAAFAEFHNVYINPHIKTALNYLSK